MTGDTNDRETGARKLESRPDDGRVSEFSQDAAENRKPSLGMGLSETTDDVDEKTRHSDGVNPKRATPSPATEKVSGAGPAIAEHSKDAKAVKSGRQGSAYIKD